MGRLSRKLLILIGLVVVTPLILLAIMSATSRPPEQPGLVNGDLAPCPDRPNCVSSQADDPRHAIAPLGFEGTAEEALAELRQVLEQIPRIEVIVAEDNYLRAEATTRLFRFVDDVEFLVDPAEQVIHVRSASRVGYSDLGANRRRIERIRAALGSRK